MLSYCHLDCTDWLVTVFAVYMYIIQHVCMCVRALLCPMCTSILCGICTCTCANLQSVLSDRQLDSTDWQVTVFALYMYITQQPDWLSLQAHNTRYLYIIFQSLYILLKQTLCKPFVNTQNTHIIITAAAAPPPPPPPPDIIIVPAFPTHHQYCLHLLGIL